MGLLSNEQAIINEAIVAVTLDTSRFSPLWSYLPIVLRQWKSIQTPGEMRCRISGGNAFEGY